MPAVTNYSSRADAHQNRAALQLLPGCSFVCSLEDRGMQHLRQNLQRLDQPSARFSYSGRPSLHLEIADTVEVAKFPIGNAMVQLMRGLQFRVIRPERGREISHF